MKMLRCGHPADRWGCCSVDLSGHLDRREICGFCYGIDDDKLGPDHRYGDHPKLRLGEDAFVVEPLDGVRPPLH